jgi:hypothetical protein
MYLVHRPLAVVAEASTGKGLELVWTVSMHCRFGRSIRSTADFAGGAGTYCSKESIGRPCNANVDSKC